MEHRATLSSYPALLALLLTLASPTQSSADTPTLVHTYAPTSTVYSIATHGNRAYLACGTNGLHIVEITPSGECVTLGVYPINLAPTPTQMFVQGTRYRYTDDDGLHTIDASNPAAPVHLGPARWRGLLRSYRSIAPLDDSVFAIYSFTYLLRHASPNQLMNFGYTLPVDNSCASDDRFLYGTAQNRALLIYDCSLPARPMVLSQTTFTNFTPLIVKPNDRILVLAASYPFRLLFVDVSNRSDPTALGQCDTLSLPSDLVLSGNRAVTAEGPNGIEIFDLQNPASPQRTALIDPAADVLCVADVGPFILAGLKDAGLQVYQSTQPFPPRIISHPKDLVGHPADTVTLSVTAQAFEGPTYLWYHNGLPLADGPNISGAQSPNLTLSSLTYDQAGSYTVVVSSLGASNISRPATLSISPIHTWGRTRHGTQSLLQSPPAHPVAITAGAYHDLTLHPDAALTAIGRNSSGQSSIPESLTNAIALDAGSDHSLALLPDATVTAWGDNHYGQTNVPTAATNLVALSAGSHHTLALQADGTVLAWGNNDYAQCSIHPAATNITHLAAGHFHSLALRADGTIVAWGENAPEPGWATNATALAAGALHSLALLPDGTVAAAGDNTFGQCDVPNSATNVVQIAAGFYHSLALRADGTVVAWGRDVWNLVSHTTNLHDIALIDSGEDHALALMAPDVPLITSLPQNLSAPSGGMAVLTAQVQGRHPLSFQWHHNQQPIPNATNQTLSIPNLTANHAGSYHLAVTSTTGTADSTESTLSILNAPPAIAPLPAQGLIAAGYPFELPARVSGSQPITVEWLRLDLPDPLSTHLILKLESAQPTDSGTYTLRASNAFGTNSSTPFLLTVVSNSTPDDLAAALDTTNLVWRTNPENPWSLSTSNSSDGVDCLVSAPAFPNSDNECWLETTVTGPAAAYWLLRDASFSDPFSYRSVSVDRLSPPDPLWQSARAMRDFSSLYYPFSIYRADLPAGTHTLRWTLGASSFPQDYTRRGTLDRVWMNPLPHLKPAANTNSTGWIFITGLTGWTGTLEYTTNLLNPTWSTQQNLTFTGANPVITTTLPQFTNPPAAFYRVRLNP